MEKYLFDEYGRKSVRSDDVHKLIRLAKERVEPAPYWSRVRTTTGLDIMSCINNSVRDIDGFIADVDAIVKRMEIWKSKTPRIFKHCGRDNNPDHGPPAELARRKAELLKLLKLKEDILICPEGYEEIEVQPVETMMKEFDLSRDEVEGMEYEMLHTRDIEKINGRFFEKI